MILGRNVEQDKTNVAYKNDNSGYLTSGVISLYFVFEIDLVFTL